MKRTWLLGSIVALLSVLFAALLAEVVLHLTNLPPEQLSHQQLFVQYDSLLGWRNIPNARGRMVSDEYARDLEYNERSMRGPVLPYEKPAGTLRVLLLGDSFVDGYTEQLGDRVSEVLQRDLTRGAGPNVEVIPMGTGGYSTDQELLWLESEGLRYHPDVVVLMFHPNDVWYNTSGRYWRGSKPRFVRAGGKLELENVPVPRPDSTSQSGSLAQRLNGWVRQNSKIYWLVARTIQNQPRLYGLSVKLGLTTPSPEMVFDAKRGVVVAGEFSIFARHPSPEVAQAWDITRELVRRIREDSDAAGAEFFTFLIPIRSRIYTQDEDVRTGLAASNDEIDVNAVVREFQSLCTTHMLPYIDPTDNFLAAADSLKRSGQRLYYRYDWHWNANGHKRAGDLLAHYIQPLLSERQQRGPGGAYSKRLRSACGSMAPDAPGQRP